METVATFLPILKSEIEALSINDKTVFNNRVEICTDWISTILKGIVPFCAITVEDAPADLEDSDGGSLIIQSINTILIVNAYDPKQSVINLLNYSGAFFTAFHLKDYTSSLGQPPFLWFKLNNMSPIDYVEWNTKTGGGGYAGIRNLTWELRLQYYS